MHLKALLKQERPNRYFNGRKEMINEFRPLTGWGWFQCEANSRTASLVPLPGFSTCETRLYFPPSTTNTLNISFLKCCDFIGKNATTKVRNEMEPL